MADLRHNKVSSAGAASPATLVGGDDWNDEHYAGGGLADQVFTRDTVPARGWKWAWPLIRETGGPTTLTPGAIVDADVLQRSGTTLIGRTIQYLLNLIATTKGDLLVRDSTDVKRLAVGTNGQVLTADSAQSVGAKWADLPAATPDRIPFVDAQTSTVDAANNTNEIELYGVNLPQNTLTAGRLLRCAFLGDRLENTSPGTLTMRFKLGATTLLTWSTDIVNNASRQLMNFNLEIFAKAVNSQVTLLSGIAQGGASSAMLFGIVHYDFFLESRELGGAVLSSEDNGAGILRLSITAQWSAASVNLSARCLGAKTLVYA